ncbi:hypothetical protein C8F01DRAFT_1250181 [Mycena amicta]|nr:hypothetical protein C8F01DRAFT_1250181 [Mycena amicta]
MPLIFNLWRDGSRWRKPQPYLREMTILCAHELALQDSDHVISSPHLRVRLKTLNNYPGFSRNPVFVIFLAICMLAFTRNRATNVLPLILGLFFQISGTSSRVVTMLSNTGICVSNSAVEHLKMRITEDAMQLAVALITSGQVFFTIFDNINVFLRKFQHRISNTNDMINATTSPSWPLTVLIHLRRRQIWRSNWLSVEVVCASASVVFTPGNGGWKNRGDIAEVVAAMMPEDRPLPLDKSDA